MALQTELSERQPDAEITIGRRINRYRRAIRPTMTQAKLAQAVGVTVGMVTKWENDNALPSMANRLKIAKALRIDPRILDYEIPDPIGEQGESTPDTAPPWAVELSAKMDEVLRQLDVTNTDGAAGRILDILETTR